MKTYIERKLIELREEYPFLSVDIYYDDIRKQFVVKLHDHISICEHFRSNHIRKSLKMALKWLKNLR